MILHNTQGYLTPQPANFAFNNQVNDLIGLPFVSFGQSKKGCDCWGLCVLYNQVIHNRQLPKYQYQNATLTQQNQQILKIEKLKKNWQKLEPAQQRESGDIVLFYIKGNLSHCAVMIDHFNFLHVLKNSNSCIESLESALWFTRCEGVYRWIA